MNITVLLLSFLCVTPPVVSQNREGEQAFKPITIADQGSFAVGGTVLVDSAGHQYHGDHAYVFYQKPVNAKEYPLVFAHGVGQFSKTWETTPDGREGFQTIFLRKGFSTYLVDQPRRGNAGRSTETVTNPHHSIFR